MKRYNSSVEISNHDETISEDYSTNNENISRQFTADTMLLQSSNKVNNSLTYERQDFDLHDAKEEMSEIDTINNELGPVIEINYEE